MAPPPLRVYAGTGYGGSGSGLPGGKMMCRSAEGIVRLRGRQGTWAVTLRGVGWGSQVPAVLGKALSKGGRQVALPLQRAYVSTGCGGSGLGLPALLERRFCS